LTLKLKRLLFYSFLFVFSFVLFIYVSFPYTILKEAVITQVMRQTGLDLRVHSLGPKLPLGFEVEKVQVNLPSGDKGIELKSATVRISVLSLVIGNLTATVDLESVDEGTLDAKVSFSILDIIGGQFIPSYVGLEAEGFAIGHLARFGLAQGQEAMKSQALVADLLGKFGVNGKLHGTLELDLNPSNPKSSKGMVNLQIKKGVLKIDKSLGMADQKFEKALLKAKLSQGQLKINDRSGFHTQGLKIDLMGGVTMKNRLEKSSLNVDLKIRLDKDLKEQYGFVIDTALGGSGGALKCQIRGTITHPNVITL
jgi:type II secretion system protein N